LRPYAGIGAGRYSYKETSDFADPGENVQSSFTAYEVMGGVEVPLWRWVKVAGEVRWITVPNALGDGGVSKEFGESDLGGLNFGVRFLVGR
jgi:opacity protein-like surface antigen